jgi:hypothetical protein
MMARQLAAIALSSSQCVSSLSSLIQGCERSFSHFGITHTNIRNKLDAQKVHKTGVVKTDLRRSHTEAGLTTTHHKCKFGADDDPSQDMAMDSIPLDNSSLSEDVERIDVDKLMEALIRDSDNDEQHEDDPLPTLTLPTSLTLPRTAAQRRIPLTLLFSFADTSLSACLDFYWKGGLKKMEREVVAYNLLNAGEPSEIAEATARGPQSGTVAGGTVESSQ